MSIILIFYTYVVILTFKIFYKLLNLRSEVMNILFMNILFSFEMRKSSYRDLRAFLKKETKIN